MEDERRVAEAEAVIADYVRRHPRAADTVEGIRRWWLADGSNYSVQVIESALTALVAAGLLERRQGAGGTIYAAAPDPRSRRQVR